MVAPDKYQRLMNISRNPKKKRVISEKFNWKTRFHGVKIDAPGYRITAK